MQQTQTVRASHSLSVSACPHADVPRRAGPSPRGKDDDPERSLSVLEVVRSSDPAVRKALWTLVIVMLFQQFSYVPSLLRLVPASRSMLTLSSSLPPAAALTQCVDALLPSQNDEMLMSSSLRAQVMYYSTKYAASPSSSRRSTAGC